MLCCAVKNNQCQDDYYRKKKNHQKAQPVLVKMWRKGTTRALLVGMQNGTGALRVLKKLNKNYHMIQQLHFQVFIQKNWKQCLKQPLGSWHSQQGGSQQLKCGSNPHVHRWMDKQKECGPSMQQNSSIQP